MAEHATLPFAGLHKARFDSGLFADLPASPEGDGDAYYATDTGAIYVGASSAWVLYEAPASNIQDDLIAAMYMASLTTKTPVRLNNIKTTTALTTIYTCPASTTVTLVNITIHNKYAGSNSVYVYLNTGGSDVRIIYETALAVNASLTFEIPIVMEAGDTLKIENGFQPIHYNITGYSMSTTITEVTPFRYAAVKASTSTDSIFTVGVGEVATITGIILHNATGGAVTTEAFEKVGANSISLLRGTSIASNAVVSISNRVLIAASSDITVANTVANVHYVICGYLTAI